MSVLSLSQITSKLNPRQWRIRAKLLFAFMLVLSLPIVGLLIGEVTTVRAVGTLREQAIEKDQQAAIALAERVESELSRGYEDVFALRDLTSTHSLTEALAAGDEEALAQAKADVQADFSAFAPYGFYQVRYIAADGQEIVRVDVRDGQPLIVPDDELQDKSQRPYFQESIGLPEGELYISPLELNVEHGEIEKPFKPVIRYATPVYYEGNPVGIVIVNVDAQPILAAMFPKMGHEGHHHMLVDEDGYFLMHWLPEKRWGRDLGTGSRLQTEYPFLASLLEGDVGSGYVIEGDEVYIYASVTVGDETTGRRWLAIMERPLAVYTSDVANVVPVLGGLIIITAVLGMLAALALANTFTRPLHVLESRVWQFAQGDYSTRVPLAGEDEFGRLAQTFNRMAESIQNHRRELQTSEERYRKLFDAAPDPVLLLDAEGTIQDCNEEAEALFMRPREELIGWKVFEVAGPEGEAGRQLFRKKFEDLRNMQVASAQITHCRLDGSCVELWRKATPLADDNGNFAGVIIYDRDITAQKEAERELQKFRRAVEQSASMIVITNREGVIEYVNPKFTEVTGYTSEEAIGQKPSILNSGEMPPEVFDDLWATVSAGKDWVGELLNRKKDGALFWVHASLSPIFDAEGNITHYLSVQEDITDRKLAEEALRTSEERFRSFFNSAPDAILTLDAEGVVTSCNPAAEELYQQPADEIVGLHVVATIVPEDDSQRREAVQKSFREHYEALRKGKEVSLEFTRSLPGGSEMVIWRKAVPLMDGEGHLRGVLVYDRDVTERKQAEEKIRAFATRMAQTSHELAVARKKAEESARLKSEFMATMSHELRTPLNAIIGYGQILLAGIAGEMSPKQHDFIGRILLNGRNLLDLINDILDLSKIEAGRLDLLHQPFNLKAWLDEVILQTRALADEKGLELEVVVDDRMPDEIVGDPDRLKQILINLLSNAIKFTDEGRVAVYVQRQSDDNWTLAVTDTGIGIPSHAQEYIFDEFRQVDGSTRRKHGGTGLGLAIVRNLALMMGGNVRVQSELGKGSTFTVLLPLVTEVPTEDSQLTEGTVE